MRKIKYFFVGILLVLFLSGCGNKSKYPYIKYQHSHWNYDTNNEQITIKEGYTLNQSHPYDVTDTENGYSITLYFEKEDTEEKDNE